MKIKIDQKNATRINDALNTANGEAYKHTISHFDDVAEIAESFEQDLQNRQLLKKDRIGAICTYRPGGLDLAKTYEFGANTTQITIKRGATGWFLIDAKRAKKYPQAKPLREIALSIDQIEKVKAKAISLAMTGVCEIKPAVSDEKLESLDTA